MGQRVGADVSRVAIADAIHGEELRSRTWLRAEYVVTEPDERRAIGFDFNDKLSAVRVTRKQIAHWRPHLRIRFTRKPQQPQRRQRQL
jgi:hypothetical protein